MKIKLLLTLCMVLQLIAFVPNLHAASSVANVPITVVSTTQSASEASSKYLKKGKRTDRLKAWWGRLSQKIHQKSKWLVQRLSLGFVGFIVMIIGGMFIVLGLVIPVIGALFLVLGIIIAFVGLLLWAILSKIGVRVSEGGNSRRRPN